MGGLAFVPAPGIYAFAYIGMALGHLAVGTARRRGREWKGYLLGKIKRNKLSLIHI